jgi:hypothetical protein
MKDLRNGILLFTLFSLASCMDEDISKLKSSVDANPAMAIPLIHSTTTLSDLLPEDENMLTDDDGAIRISYRQDSIAQVLSDSLLKIEDQAPTEENFSVGAIDLANFSTNMTVQMSDLTANLQDQDLVTLINAGIDSTQSSGLGKAYFPPISPQSGGVYSAQGSDKFQFVEISSGELAIEITNNLAIDISSLQLSLKNADDQSEIGTFNFENILSGSSLVEDIQLNEATMYSNLEMEIVQLSSDGSGSDPLDQNQWVPMSSDDELNIDITGTGMVATSGMVKFPSQDGPNDDFVIDMEFEDDVQISLIDLLEGEFVYTYNSDLNTTLDLIIEIEQLKDNSGVAFSRVISIENTNGQTIEASYPLDDYNFDFTNSTNQMVVSYSTDINSTDEFVSYDENDSIMLTIGMQGLDFEQVQGYFGQMEEVIEEDVLDIDVSAIEDIASGIRLESPTLTFFAENGMGIPFNIDLNLVGTNNGESVSLGGPVLEIAPESTTTTEFNNSNSSLVDLIALSPTEMRYSGTVLSNPNGVTENTISPNTDITIGFDMDLPLHLRIEDAVTADTLALDFGSEESSSHDIIESVKLNLHTENEFPLDISVTMFFRDSISAVVLDSLNFDLLEAASVDEDGRTIEPKIYNSNVELNANQIDALFNANQALLDIRMNSYDYENTAVRLYTDYQFVIGAGVILELKTEE